VCHFFAPGTLFLVAGLPAAHWQSKLPNGTQTATGEPYALEGLAHMSEVASGRATDDELLLAIVHDIRAHLRKSVTAAQRLEKQTQNLLTSEQQVSLDQILTAGRDMNTLLGRLVKYALAASSAKDQPLGDVGVMFDTAVRRLAGKHVDAEIESESLRSSGIQTPASIESVLGELLDNALKFRQGPVKITVLVEEAGGNHLFGIKDTGIGFDPQFGEKIMRPLERLHPAHIYPGCGLGLAICQRTIEACGGKLWAESKLGNGSVFWFSLPAQV
jgi:signal transduction histidine kinase